MAHNDGIPLINPYIAGSPVKDAAMFFGREDVYAWLRQHLRGVYQDNAIVLYGERRSGKTSVLYQMKDKLGDNHYIPVLLDLQGMNLEGMDGFLWEVARKIILTLRGVEGLPSFDRPARQDFEQNPYHQFDDVFLPPVLTALGRHSLLLMFDEANRLSEKVEVGDLPRDVFDYLRALLQQTNHLNFLFALGSRIESNHRGSSHLFNLAVYRKISFLEQDFVEDLITRPVEKYFSYTRPAIERIHQLTSGQPYYTQLLCHNLFTHWTIERPSRLDVADIEAVIPDVLEQGTPNFQFVWEDSTPVERAILAALADRIPQYKGGVMRRNLERAMHKAKLYPSNGDVTGGLRELFERDVINDQEPFQLRVALMQQWITKFRRLDWMHEELGETARQWEQQEEQRRAQAPTTVERVRRWAAPVLIILLIVLIVEIVIIRQRSTAALQASESRRSTEVAQLSATLAANSTRVAESQMALALAVTKAAEAANRGNSQEAAIAQATAESLRRLNIALAATATRMAAAEIIAKAEPVVVEYQIEVASAKTSTPFETNTPIPTISPTPSPLPTATASPTPYPPTRPRQVLADSLQGVIAYPAFDGQMYNLYFGNVSSGESRRYRNQASQPAFNADGSRIAFQSWAGNSRGLVTASSSGGNETLITNFLEDNYPTWSPDSHTILFFTRRAPGRPSLLAKTPANTDFQQTQPTFIGVEGETPVWNVDGQVIFRGWNNTAPGLRLAQADFSNIQPVTMSNQDFAPALSPDGKQVAFMSTRDGNWEVYVVNADASDLRRLTNNPAMEGLPTWSPDSRVIAFASNAGGQWAIWGITPDGSQQQKLLDMAGPPDGIIPFNQEYSHGWIEEHLSWAPITF